MGSYLEIMDTTLRDGEQVFGVSYTSNEKFTIARFLLEKLRVDRLECCSALSSDADIVAAQKIALFASEKLHKPYAVEALAFMNDASIQWLKKANIKTANLLVKGSLLHLEKQLSLTPKQQEKLIEDIVIKMKEENMRVHIYLEDVSYGIQKDKEFVYALLEHLSNLEVERVMLPDTRGLLAPFQVHELFTPIFRDFKKLIFDFHAHNDYGLATANTLEAARLPFRGIHATVNGMGERTGNTSLEEVAVAIKDFTDRRLNLVEKYLTQASTLVQKLSGKRVAWNKPIVGEDVFTHVAGIHADGEKKGNVYTSKLSASRFGRYKAYSIGKLSGKASIELALKHIGISLTKDQIKEVLKRVVSVGEKKNKITEADLLTIASDVLKMKKDNLFSVIDINILSDNKLPSSCVVKLNIDGNPQVVVGKGNGGFDAFMKAIKPVCKKHNIFIPTLIDFEVGIPKGGGTDALVETTITWMNRNGKIFKTIGVNADQVLAAIASAEKAINYSNTLLKKKI